MKQKRILAFLLSMAMTVSMLSCFTITALAEETQTTATEKNITLGTTALKGGQKSNVYFGNFQQTSAGNTQPTGTENIDWIKKSKAINSKGPYYNIDPIKWRVLSNSNGKTLLLSDQNLDMMPYYSSQTNVTWENSTIRSWLNGDEFYNFAFSAYEKKAVAKTNVVNEDNEQYEIDGGENTEDYIFLLSIADVRNAEYGFTYDKHRYCYNTDYNIGGGKYEKQRYSATGKDYWWLRSPGMYKFFAAYVNGNGSVDDIGQSVYNTTGMNTTGVRPALNLNSSNVLFTSAAAGGKSAVTGTLSKNSDYENNEYKLTMLDSDRNFTVSDTSAKSVKAGDTISLEYTGAKTGDNEYVSAMIVNDKDEVLYYGQLEKAKTGTVEIDNFTVPQDISNGKYILNLFNEQINSDKKTDFSSAFQTITLNIKGIPTANDFTFTQPNDLTYDGNAKTATVTSDKDGMGIIMVKYYQVADEVQPKNAGTYNVKIDVAESDNYFATTDLTDENWNFTITPKDITNADITLGNSLAYNGTEQTQTISKVEVDGLTLIKDTDYTVSDNTGTEIKNDYVLTILGIGNFTGTATKQFAIAKATPTENPEKKTTARVKRGKTLAEATVTEGEMLGLNDTVLEGVFAWVDDTKTMSADGTEQMTFTPTDTNYAPITIDVAVSTYSSSGGGGVTRYTVKFNTNGGNTITSQTVKKNGTATEPTTPTREIYIFDGWYTDSEFTNEYDFDTKVTKNITLYAKWVENEVGEPSDDNKDDEPQTDEWKNPFTDVKENDWYFADVKYANENGLMSGVTNTTFAPNDSLTRAMLVTVLWRAEGEPNVDFAMPFTDVNDTAYYAEVVRWAASENIISGITETEFAPDMNITREQIAAIIYRYAKYKGYDVSVGEDANILSYTDFDEISEYAIEAMQYAVGSGLMKGKTESTLNPKDNATRAEIAAILSRFIESNK